MFILIFVPKLMKAIYPQLLSRRAVLSRRGDLLPGGFYSRVISSG